MADLGRVRLAVADSATPFPPLAASQLKTKNSKLKITSSPLTLIDNYQLVIFALKSVSKKSCR
jgi:hypothetical protein